VGDKVIGRWISAEDSGRYNEQRMMGRIELLSQYGS
jgi:hypothetical protein